MRFRTAILSVAAALSLSACIPSVNPYYTERDVVFEPDLVGEWTDPDSQRWMFERLGERDAYELTVVEENGNRGTLEATLFEIGDRLYLDLIATDIDFAGHQSALINDTVFPGHIVMHVTREGPALAVSAFDFEWLADHLEQNPRALDHISHDDRPLLTGSTRELRRFLSRHADEGQLFTGYAELTRL